MSGRRQTIAQRISALGNRKRWRPTTREQRRRYMRALALKRWANTRASERSQYGRRAIAARWAKHKAS